MAFDISSELAAFRHLMGIVPRERYSVRRVCDDAFVIAPTGFGAAKVAGKQIGATFLAVVHGNEWAGLGALNSVLEHIVSGNIQIRFPVAFALGNPTAALQNKRFMERDLNRCFDREAAKLAEEKRADELESILSETAWLLDLHQTREISPHAFFIFPHTTRGFAFARAIAPHHPVVTHWGDPFSAEGRCSDEFVNAKGGVGLTLELGRNSFDPYHMAVGVDAVLWTLRVVGELSGTEPVVPLKRALRSTGDIFTWAAVMPWPAEGTAVLDPGWTNFRAVQKGQRLGMLNDKNGATEIIAPESGYILFPKYPDPVKDAGLPRPTEIGRIMKKIAPSELPDA